MSSMLADIDATCASLGYDDGSQYIADPEALAGLKVVFTVIIRDISFYLCLLCHLLASYLDNATRW